MGLVVESYNHAILTLTERSTNMLFMTMLKEGKKAKPLGKEARSCCCLIRNICTPSLRS